MKVAYVEKSAFDPINRLFVDLPASAN